MRIAIQSSIVVIALLLAASSTRAQDQFIMADRNNDAMYRVRDLDHNGIISDPAETFLFFNATNAASTPGPMNPSAQAVSLCRVVIMGDQGNNLIYRLVDLTGDGDAQDLNESNIFCGPGNTGGIVFGFPTGAAFDSNCVAYVTNAGNGAFPIDAIYRLQDLNGDGDAMDNVLGTNEATLYVADGAFGAGNGRYSPQELFFDGQIGYVKNSSAALFGIYRFEDSDNSGRADDAGEFTVFINASNASAAPILAGLPLEPDRVQRRAMYTLQIAAGGVDQLVRAMDINSDLTAQDAGENRVGVSIRAHGDVNTRL